MAEPTHSVVSVVERTCDHCHARKPCGEFPSQSWRCYACDAPPASQPSPIFQPLSASSPTPEERPPAELLPSHASDDVRSLTSSDCTPLSDHSTSPRESDEGSERQPTPELGEGKDREEELMDSLVVLGRHLDALVGVSSDAGHLLREEPHAAALLVAFLLLTWLHRALPLTLGMLLGLLLLLVAQRPTIASSATHCTIAARSLGQAAHILQWATALPSSTLASGPFVGAAVAWLLSPMLPTLGALGSPCPGGTLPPWAGFVVIIAGAVIWASRRREEAVAYSALYFGLFFAILTASPPSPSHLLLLALALGCHIQGLREWDPNRRLVLLGLATAFYTAYLSAVGLSPELRALFLGISRFFHSLRGRPLQRLAHLLVRAISELPGVILFGCSLLSVRQGQKSTLLHQKLGWFIAAFALFLGALGAWDLVEPPEWLLELSEMLADSMQFLAQLPQQLLYSFRRARRLASYYAADFFHFTVVLPLRLLQLALRFPRWLLSFASGGLFGALGRILSLPLQLTAFLTQRLRLMLAEHFWILEYSLKRLANIIGSVGDALSGERVSETITG
eukprot:GGOE01020526.1.p1 GENE.GGOE01020526.1~~GGOE01020526.1.p1  ORF type:complete len:588 (+),score=125.50 GGOE01020526.1:69-1766(+)